MLAATIKVQRKKHKTLRPADLSGPSHVKVGFPAGTGNVDKAIWNEFGTAGGASGGGWGGPIPERPFMRNSIKGNRGKYQSFLKAHAAKLLRGETDLRGVLSRLGVLAQADMVKSLNATNSPPNSPVTIARKGSSKPLVDTGAMRQSITYKVED